jgi:hypothetical protein
MECSTVLVLTMLRRCCRHAAELNMQTVPSLNITYTEENVCSTCSLHAVLGAGPQGCCCCCTAPHNVQEDLLHCAHVPTAFVALPQGYVTADVADAEGAAPPEPVRHQVPPAAAVRTSVPCNFGLFSEHHCTCCVT